MWRAKQARSAGKHSLVAKTVGARAYRTRPPRSIAFYTYWASVPSRDGSPAGTGEIYGRPGCAVGAWPTNDGLLMTYLAWRAARPADARPGEAAPGGRGC